QIGLPYHWGQSGLSTGDSANDLLPQTLDPNVSIPATKSTSCDIQPGRRPRGPALTEYVAEYRRRAGVNPETGTEAERGRNSCRTWGGRSSDRSTRRPQPAGTRRPRD